MPAAPDMIEPDRLPGAPHPREQSTLAWHEEAEQAFLGAIASGRLHHAWLIGGPEGIGKATLAYRVARRLLAGDGAASGLALDPSHPVFRQVAALSHPDLAVLRRSPGSEDRKASTTIPVEAVRRVLTLFASTAAGGGYRVCIVDSAEDLTASSANALLKLIEEPPPRSVFLIVSHAPQRVLPTIRSRCRRLAMRPLDESSLRRALATLGGAGVPPDPALLEPAIALGEGSVRRTLEMLDADKIALTRAVGEILAGLPRLDLRRVLSLAEALARRGAEESYELALETVRRFVSDRLEAGATLGAARLAPLVEVCEKVSEAARVANTFNLDRRPLLLSLFGDLAKAVERAA